MNRGTYLANPVVQHFIKWMAGHLDSTMFQHSYTNRMTGQTWSCQSLSDAYRQYHWPHPPISRLDVNKGHTTESNAAALLALKEELQEALNTELNDDIACQAAIDVMIWGGVQVHNVDWLIENRQGLAAILTSIRDAIDQDDTDAAVLVNPLLRFNAGMTKVYSLICRDFIIYDSRVAAALGWAVVKYCTQEGLASVPAELAFPWAPAKEGNSVTPKNRNPGQGKFTFPRLKAGTLHAQWNMRASWLLHAVLAYKNDPDQEFMSGDGLRKLEAALFMLGYDLGLTKYGIQTMDQSIEELGWIDGFTASKRSPFRYRITSEEIIVEGKTRFAIAVINQTLSNLQIKFGSSPFPLANSADGVPAGTSPEGIGLAYRRATENRGNAPDTSKLAAILKDLGVLSYKPQGGLWTINHDLVTVSPTGQIDINPILARFADDSDAC